MNIKTDTLSITSTHSQRHFPFRVGELLPGTILQKLPDGFYQILLGGNEFNAYYPNQLEGQYLFKVMENKGQILLKLISSKSKKGLDQFIAQFKQLSSLSHDSVLQKIVNLYLKYNLLINESEILLIYRFFKKRLKKDHRFIETVITMRAKGITILPHTIKKWVDYDTNLSRLGQELNQLLDYEDNPLKQFLKTDYLISPKKRDLKVQLKDYFTRMGYLSSDSLNELKMKSFMGENFFLLNLLKFSSQDQDNKLIKKLIEQYKTEKESSFKSDNEKDQFFFSIPLLTEENRVDYFKVKSFPNNQNKKEKGFYFEIELSHLNTIKGYCFLSAGQIHLHLHSENKKTAYFLNKHFIKLFNDKEENHFPLGNWTVKQKDGICDFLSFN